MSRLLYLFAATVLKNAKHVYLSQPGYIVGSDFDDVLRSSHLISPVGRIYSVKPMRWISLSGSVIGPSSILGVRSSTRRYGRQKHGRAAAQHSPPHTKEESLAPARTFASLRSFHQRGLDDAMKFGARKQGMALRKNWFSMRKGQAMSRLCVASRGCPGNSESIRCIRLIHYFDVANPRSLAPCATGFPTMLVRSSPTR